jgi:hypothetical protein
VVCRRKSGGRARDLCRICVIHVLWQLFINWCTIFKLLSMLRGFNNARLHLRDLNRILDFVIKNQRILHLVITMVRDGSLVLFEKAYEDLTTAVARANRLCRRTNEFIRKSCVPITLNASRLLKKRGRPIGSKNSKHRVKDQIVTMQQSGSDCFGNDHQKISSSIALYELSAKSSCTCCTTFSNLDQSIWEQSLDRKASSLGFDSDLEPSCLFCHEQHLCHVRSSFDEGKVNADVDEGKVNADEISPKCWELPIP